MNVEKTLEERGNRYGTFVDNAETIQKCLEILMEGKSAHKLWNTHREAIHMIVHKLARIVNGDADYKDSWVDIAGYATLMAKELTDD